MCFEYKTMHCEKRTLGKYIGLEKYIISKTEVIGGTKDLLAQTK